MKKLTTEQWVSKAVEVHGDLYNYSNTTYVTKRTKVTILCKRCNTNFEQWPSDHLKGCGCFSCNNKPPQKYDTNIFVEKAKAIHGDKYNYNKVIFNIITDKLVIICNSCNTENIQKACSHLIGHEACSCYVKSSAFSYTKPAILYYLSINNSQAYKIGITNRSVEDRFTKKELSIITILKTTNFNTGKEARKQEKFILSNYKEHKYTGPNLLDSGNTELFSINILNLERNNNDIER